MPIIVELALLARLPRKCQIYDFPGRHLSRLPSAKCLHLSSKGVHALPTGQTVAGRNKAA
eukprot:4204827-Amphidinium_carterae.1